MLASISKLVDKPFVVGFIVPVLLGAFGILTLIRDLEPFNEIYDTVVKVRGFTELTTAVLLLWVAAILMLLFNDPLLRMLEGYFGPFAQPRWRKRMEVEYLNARKQLRADFNTNIKRAGHGKEGETDLGAAWRDYRRQLRQFCKRWPSIPRGGRDAGGARHLVLPTRFGNVIRAFESYPETLYGIDAIPGWLRLQGVISKEFEVLLADAQAQVNFFVNVWFFSLLFSAVAAARFAIACYESLPKHPMTLLASWGFPAAFVAGLIISWLAYEAAVGRAVAWGDLVRSAFDLFLPELAKKLGYQLPRGIRRRRDFWNDATSSFLYNEPMPATWRLATETSTKGSTERVGAKRPDDDTREDDDTEDHDTREDDDP